MSQHIDPTPKQTDLDEFNGKLKIGGFLDYKDKSFYNVVVSAGAVYTSLGNVYSDFGAPTGSWVLSFYVRGWSGAPGSFSVVASTSGEQIYLICSQPGTFSYITVRLWYIKP